MSARGAGLAIALALAAGTMTADAAAEETTTATTTTASASAATPLAPRPSHPLGLADAPSKAGGTGWKIVLGLSALTVGLVWWKRRKTGRGAKIEPRLRVVSRASIGLRSELLVVDIDGQSILLGVTPTSVRHLADLESRSATRTEEMPTSQATQGLGGRFAALLERAGRETDDAPASPEPPARRTVEAAAEPREIEEQARGLLRMVRGGRPR